MSDKGLTHDEVKVLEIDQLNKLGEIIKKQPRFIPIVHIGAYIVIGPFMERETMGCPKCIELRMISNIGDKRVTTSNKMNIPDEILEEAISYVSNNVGKAIFYDPIRRNISAKEVFAFPQCPICSPVEASKTYTESKTVVSDGNYRARPFNELVTDLKRYSSSLLDPEVGIMKGHYRGLSAAMPLIAFDAKLGERTYDSYGRSDTYEASYYTGMLEGIERFHGVYPNSRSVVIKSEQELKKDKSNFVPMEKFLHYEEEQYKEPNFILGKYTKDHAMKWRKAINIVDQSEKLIPEQVAYFSTEQVYEGESKSDRYIYESSNGTALGSNYDEAILSSLFEYVERDGFFVYWYNKAEPVKLTGINNIQNETIKGLLRYMDYLRYKVHVFDITLESELPAVWVILESLDDDNTMAFYNAAGANICPVKALESALIEAATAVQVFSIMIERKFDLQRRDELLNNHSLVSGLEEHLFLYSAKEMRTELAFALDSQRVEKFLDHFRDIGAKQYEGMTQNRLLKSVVNKMNKYHSEILVHDMSSPWLEKMGLYCVKAMIPSMQTVSFGHQYRNINKKRIIEAIEINGLVKKELANDEINMTPHPFP